MFFYELHVTGETYMVVEGLENVDFSFLYSWVLLPILIFFARVGDVTLGTIRIIFVSKGIKYLAPLVGFVEILIWLLAIGQIMQNFDNAYYYLFYAGGFATGNFVGIIIEEKLSIGTIGIRVITRKDASALTIALRKARFGVTVVDAEGPKGPVKLIYSIIKRNTAEQFIKLVNKYIPLAFYSIEDIREVSEILPSNQTSIWRKSMIPFFRFIRKGK
jgi:uncharacterized protein YebE (UPF0316 family)